MLCTLAKEAADLLDSISQAEMGFTTDLAKDLRTVSNRVRDLVDEQRLAQ